MKLFVYYKRYICCIVVVLFVEKYMASGRTLEVLFNIEMNRKMGGTLNSSEHFEEEKDPCRESSLIDTEHSPGCLCA